jgi:hypothetical protein
LSEKLDHIAEYLINAIKVSTDKSEQSALSITSQIEKLSVSLADANQGLKEASSESSKLGKRLNLLTAVVAVAGLISAGATAFYAWETRQQVQLMQEQIKAQVAQKEVRPGSSSSPSPPPPPHSER